ncbi:ribonuclease P protein subunit p30-like [Mucor ambiguus]|uniref:Ribonuclease P protein subunit p30-like n=1 Tax=Mucor ambiguus TaxID=91626 RepID=A0A0C9MBD6_9FUNG|nr:ribonuclease P protein subunit p30-like [Mucor ambiguus]
MYCDLNIPCSAQPDRSAIDKLKLVLSRLTQLNEATVALNYTMDSKIPKPMNESVFNPSILNSKYPLKLYKRVTIDAIDPQHIAELRSQFDLIALRTNDYTVFHAACQSNVIDIISLHVDERLTFELSSVDIKNALEKNIYFEICYAPAIRVHIDAQARTYTVQLAKQLFEYTQGQNVIISSEAQIVSEIRNPADVFYFSGGQTHTTSTTRTTTSSSENGTTSSVVVREISENELSGLSLESTQNYEITDDDCLTKYDFYSLMDSDDDESETESESDIEYHWFPSLLKTSFIEFLDDKEQEAYMEDDTYDAKVQIEENSDSTALDDDEEEEEEEEEIVQHHVRRGGKRPHKRHAKKHSKRPRRSEQVPVEVVHVVL